MTSFHISDFQVWEIHQVAASREMWNSNIARFVTDVQCQSLSPFSCDGRVPGLSPPKSIGVGGCLLLLLPLPNPKASILPKVTRDSAFTLVSLITNECHEMKTEKNNLCGLVSHILIFDLPHLHGHLFALAFCTMYYAEKEVPNCLVMGALRYTLWTIFSYQPNKLRHILKFVSWYTV